MFKVGITGGIGSGKSTLCKIFSDYGIPVYNSDAEAKRLMHEDKEIHDKITETFGSQSYIGDYLNRSYIAEKVFTNTENLAKLNSIVHPRVKSDFLEWCQRQDAPYVILECAILFEAKFNDYVDKSICVLSPKSLRIERVISRDGLTQKEVEDRIANQLSDEQLDSLCDYCVVNIEREDLDHAARMVDKKIKYDAAQN